MLTSFIYNDLIKTTELQLTNVTTEWSWPIPEFKTDGIKRNSVLHCIICIY